MQIFKISSLCTFCCGFVIFFTFLSFWRLGVLSYFPNFISASLLFSYFHSFSLPLSLIYLSASLPIYLYIFFLHSLSPYLPLYQSISPSTISLSRSLSYLSIFLPIYLFISTSTLSPFLTVSLIFALYVNESLCFSLLPFLSLSIYLSLPHCMFFLSLSLFYSPAYSYSVSLSLFHRRYFPIRYISLIYPTLSCSLS